MNVVESKTNILLEAVRNLFIADTTNTGYTSREINYYVGQRIYRTRMEIGDSFPQITLDVDEYESELALPSQRCLLTIQAHVKKDAPYALTSLGNLSNRIEYLLNKKPSSINLAVNNSKKLRCRLINKISGLLTTDELKEVHTKTLIFDVILGDEILSCSN